MAKFSYDKKEMSKFPEWIMSKVNLYHSRHICGLGMDCHDVKDKTKYYPIYGTDVLSGEVVEDFTDYLVGDNYFVFTPYKVWLRERKC